MASVFLGEYKTKFTGQGRVILPKRLRQELSGESKMVLTRGFEGCIWGFSTKEWEKESKSIIESSVTEERARYLRRYLFSGSVPAELDNQGRFVIPATLLTYANLGNEVVIIGAGDHFEVWDEKTWHKQLRVLEKEYGSLS